ARIPQAAEEVAAPGLERLFGGQLGPRAGDECLVDLRVALVLGQVGVFGEDAEFGRVDRVATGGSLAGVGVVHPAGVVFQVGVEEPVDGSADVRAVAVPADADHPVQLVAGAGPRVQPGQAAGHPLVGTPGARPPAL